MNVVRLEGYDNLETGRKLAQEDLSRITSIGLATQEDLANDGADRARSWRNKLRWTDDHILCFVGKFELNGTTYVIDMLWQGEDRYADFKYANESEKAKKSAISSIKNWIECTIDTGGFYDPATGIISDVRGIVHLNESGEPNRLPGFEHGDQ